MSKAQAFRGKRYTVDRDGQMLLLRKRFIKGSSCSLTDFQPSTLVSGPLILSPTTMSGIFWIFLVFLPLCLRIILYIYFYGQLFFLMFHYEHSLKEKGLLPKCPLQLSLSHHRERELDSCQSSSQGRHMYNVSVYKIGGRNTTCIKK